jgi:hypothetical protein
MSEEALPVSTVTLIKALTATVVALSPEPAEVETECARGEAVALTPVAPLAPGLAEVEAESAREQAAALTPVAPLAHAPAVAPLLAVETAPRGALALRLQRLSTHTLPIAWYRIARVGPAGLVGGAAVLAAILIAALAVVGGRNATEALSAQIAHAQAHPSAAVVSDAGVSKVVAALPQRQEMPAVIGLVLEQAQAANVTLDNGHYNYSVPKGGNGVGRYELEFPVKAPYPNVRDFINRTLSAVPAAGLEKLRIERKVVGDPVVSADIRFVVFVRAEP